MSMVKRNSYWFPMFLAVLVLISGVIVYAGLQKLSAFLESYEEGVPASALAAFLEKANSEDYASVLSETGFAPSRFAGSAQGEEYLRGLFGASAGRLEAAADPSAEGSYYIYDAESGVKLTALTVAPAQGGGWTLSLPYPEPEGSLTISAPEGARVFVNSVPLTEADLTGETSAAEGFSGVTSDIALPQNVEYSAEGFLGRPEVTAETAEGASLTVEREGSACSVLPAEASDGFLETALPLMEAAARTYARFITEDAQFDELAALLYPQTEFYAAVRGFYNGWYIDHDLYEFRDVESGPVLSYGDDAFSGDIRFTYVIKKGGNEYEYPSAYRMYFMLIDAVWKCVSIETL